MVKQDHRMEYNLAWRSSITGITITLAHLMYTMNWILSMPNFSIVVNTTLFSCLLMSECVLRTPGIKNTLHLWLRPGARDLVNSRARARKNTKGFYTGSSRYVSVKPTSCWGRAYGSRPLWDFPTPSCRCSKQSIWEHTSKNIPAQTLLHPNCRRWLFALASILYFLAWTASLLSTNKDRVLALSSIYQRCLAFRTA